MARTTEAWWYALVQASPMPEIGERVNIGVLVGNGRPMALTYAAGLPRLAGLASDAELRLYVRVLDDAKERVQGGIDLDALQTRIGPQLVVAEPHHLVREPASAFIEELSRAFLQAPAPSEPTSEATGERRHATAEIDRYLGSILPALAPTPMKRVTPRQLYPDHSLQIFSGHVPHLARGMRAARDDVLIDGVVIEPTRLAESLHQATVRIDRAFWYYRRAKGEIERAAGRGIVTVGLLMDGAEDRDPTVEDARSYVREAWERHADHVIDTREQAQLGRLRTRIAGLIAG